MKNTILLASVIATGLASAAWIIKRRREAKSMTAVNVFSKKSHHRTDVFAKAKEK